MIISLTAIQSFQNLILDWYSENKRDLPWRDAKNSYHILVSEVMSQQTQVSRVIPKFLHFIEQLPDYQSLAYCDKTTLLALWSGLWYNNRALRLQAAARAIHEQFHDILPDTEKILLSLPGIGKYSARALLAFVYDQEVPVIDINIRRVICHHFSLNPAIKEAELANIAYTLIPPGQSKDWHNALMDYGAMVLTSKKTGIKSAPQSKFHGSKRWVRWSIIKKLIAEWSQNIQVLQSLFPHEAFTLILEGMVKDNLIVINKQKISIA